MGPETKGGVEPNWETKERKSQKESKTENSDSILSSDSEFVVPDDDKIDERFRCLDEVTDHFYEEKLLGPNTHRSVLNTAEIAKKGQINLSKTKGTENKGKSKSI